MTEVYMKLKKKKRNLRENHKKFETCTKYFEKIIKIRRKFKINTCARDV